MPALQFTRDLAEAIRAGRKTQTLRNKLPGNCVVGQRLTLQNGYHSESLIGHAVVFSVDLIKSKDLNDEDARLDGFQTLAELHARLRKMKASRALWRIRWVDVVLAKR